jgi:hypothetical protein
VWGAAAGIRIERCTERGGKASSSKASICKQRKDALSRCGDARLDGEARACMLCLDDVRKW